MTLILKILWLIVGHRAKLKVIANAKRHGMIAYLRVLQGSRHAIIGTLLAIFVLQLMMLALVGALVTGVWLIDIDQPLKIQILFGIFTGLFTLPALVLAVALSERVWFKASGAAKIVEDLRKSA